MAAIYRFDAVSAACCAAVDRMNAAHDNAQAAVYDEADVRATCGEAVSQAAECGEAPAAAHGEVPAAVRCAGEVVSRAVVCGTAEAPESFDPALFAGASCALGVFDGVHAGHRFIISRAVRFARAAGSRALVVTFDIDPDELFNAGGLKKIMSNEQRALALASLDVDGVVVVPFTRAFAALSPDDFLDCAFGGHVPASIHVGHDFRFGSHAQGTIADLRAWADRCGMTVDASELLSSDGAPVTSTRIRALLSRGELAAARELLGAPYTLRGQVMQGRGEGRDMGFRTANLHVPDALLALGDGVYAAYALVGGVRYKAAVSVGVAPTFADRTVANVEAHILDFSDDLYGETIMLEFAAYLRPMMKFNSLEELIATVQRDIAWVRENL